MLTCFQHPERAAELECVPCRTLLCGACAHHHAGGKTAECRTCGALLLPLAAARGPVSRAPERLDAERPLLERLPETVRYLRQPSVVLVLVAVAVFRYLCGFMFTLEILAEGVVAAMFFEIVELSAFGKQGLDTPDFVSFWESILAPLVKYVATVLPFLLLVAISGTTVIEAIFSLTGMELLRALGPWIVLALVWLAFWPLLIIVGAVSGSIIAIFDPRAWARTLRALGSDYALAAGAFYAILVVDVFVVRPMLGWIIVRVPFPIVPTVAGHFVLLGLLALRARILGEACRPHMGD